MEKNTRQEICCSTEQNKENWLFPTSSITKLISMTPVTDLLELYHHGVTEYM